MGLLKKYFAIFLFSILLFGCARMIKLSKLDKNAEIVSQYGNSSQRNFYFDKNIEIQKEPFWSKSTYGSYSNSPFAAYDSILFIADLGGRVTALNIYNGKKIGEIKYKGGIEQTPIIERSNLIFIVNEEKENYSSLIVYDFINAKDFRELKLDGKITNEMIYQNEKIFILSDFGKLYKVSGTGMKEWEIDLKENFLSDPAADENNLYLCSIYGNLYAVDKEEGKIIYKKKITKEMQCGIVVKDEALYFGDELGNVFSVNKNIGSINWRFDTKHKIKSAPALDSKSLYIGNLNGDLFSINIDNGKQNWKFENRGLINTTPLVFANVVIQPNVKLETDIIDKFTGKPIDKIQFEGRCRTSPFFYNNCLFFGIDKDEIYCYQMKGN